MPIYQYRCPECGRELEVITVSMFQEDVVTVPHPLQSMINPKGWGRTKKGRPICRVCDVKMAKIPTRSASILKGEGWGRFSWMND